MAIAKVGSAGGSAGAIGYVLSEDETDSKKPEILAGSFGSVAEIKKEFEVYNKLNKRVKNQATHISISLPPDEHLDATKKVEFAEKLLEKLDFKNVPYLVVEHHDKDYEHFHIVAGRIRDDGTTVKDWNIADRAIEATKELEKDFGLKQVEYIKSKDRRIKHGEYKQMERTGEISIMAEAKLVIDEALKNQPKVKEFVENLQKAGFELKPNISESTGKMNGFSFKKDELTFKSSAIAKNYSWQNLQKNGLDYDQGRDKDFLIGVKNEFTKKPNDESRGNRGTETSERVTNSAESIINRTESEFIKPESIAQGSEREFIQSLSEGNKTGSESFRDQKRNFENQNYSSEIDSGKIWNDSGSADFAKQFDETQLLDGTISENRSDRTQRESGKDKTADSGIGERVDEYLDLKVIANTPKLKDPPQNKQEVKDKSSSEIEF